VLPSGWEEQATEDGRIYYIDHVHKVTTWEHPCSPQQSMMTNRTPRREMIVGDAEDELLLPELSGEPWMSPPPAGGTRTSIEISLVVMDPEKKTPRVVVAGSRDVNEQIQREFATNSCATGKWNKY
jgi:hypothetical protein